MRKLRANTRQNGSAPQQKRRPVIPDAVFTCLTAEALWNQTGRIFLYFSKP